MREPPTKLDLDKLSPEDRERVQKALNRRNYPFSIHTLESFATAWREAAARDGKKLREWVEDALNKEASK